MMMMMMCSVRCWLREHGGQAAGAVTTPETEQTLILEIKKQNLWFFLT